MTESIEPVLALLLVVVEHAKVGIEELLSEQLEELFPHSPFVNSLLSNELHLQLLVQFQVAVVEELERVIHNILSVHLQNKVWIQIIQSSRIVLEHVHDVCIHEAIVHFPVLGVLAAVPHDLTLV
jgi:hypothetical protein